MDTPAPSTGSGLDPKRIAATLFEDARTPRAPVIEGFTNLSFIARGGLSEVWRAHWEEKQGLPVAIKVPRRVDDEFFARLEAEAAALQALDHPNIVRLFDVRLAEDGRPCLVLEFIEGKSLADILPADGFSMEKALGYYRQVLDAVEEAHRRGILHRDLKPSNILVGAGGEVKVADFGLAADIEGRAVRLALTESGSVAGTVEYLPPEAFHRGSIADERTDIYALGILLYELLTGEPPRGGWQEASAIRRVDIRLDEVIHKAIHRDPDKRYGSIDTLRSDLDRIASSKSRFSGSPRRTLACQLADAVWSLAGSFAFVLAVSTAFHLEDLSTRLPMNLFGDRGDMICAWLTTQTLLITCGVMGIWQTARLWRFRKVPMREALPSPFGLVLGDGAIASILVLLAQILLFILPLVLAVRFFGTIDWWRQDATTWGHVLAVTDYLGFKVGIWDWSANWDGKDAWLKEVTINTNKWYVDPQNPHDKIYLYPGFEPAIMVAGLVSSGTAVVASAVCAAMSWWERHRTALIVIAVSASATLVVWQWLALVDRRREAEYHRERIASDPDPSHSEGFKVFVEFTQGFLRRRNVGFDFEARLKDYAPQVGVNGQMMGRDSGLLDHLKEENRLAEGNRRVWEAPEFNFEGGSNEGRVFVKRYYYDSSETPGEAFNTGGLEELVIFMRRMDDGRIEIHQETVTRTPYYKATHEPPSIEELEEFVDGFLEALAEPGCPRLEDFFAERMLLSPQAQARLFDELRIEREGWRDLSIRRTAMELPVPLAGSRREVDFEAKRDGNHSKLGKRTEKIAWKIEVAKIGGKWRVVRLRR